MIRIHGVRFLSGRALLTAVLLLSFGLQAGRAADALKPFKNYFVTGDYVVGGVGLRGQGVSQVIPGGAGSYATGVIHMSGVPGYVANGIPQHADIVAAYLYWETIAGSSVNQATLAVAAFRGLKVVGTQIAPAGTMACWSSGGGSGNQSGAQSLLVFRADVLRYLPYKKDAVTGRPLGQRLVNDSDLAAEGFAPHSVSVADSGAGGTQSPSSGNQAFLSEGASLVVVYRIAGAPQKSVVIYDGGYTFSSINPLMTQNILGFYEASAISPAASPAAKMTHIVGDGDVNFKEQLTVNGSVPAEVPSDNAFEGALGFSWDNLTLDVSGMIAEGAASISTGVTPGNPASTDCLSWAAIVFSTTVKDSDGDGLLDKWETTDGGAPIPAGFAPDGARLPDLKAMGANAAVKDIFVEIDYMCSSVVAGVCDTSGANHTHRPLPGALTKVTAAFAAKSIAIHFDVGEALPETSCGAIQTPTCPFPAYPGTVSWKNGFQLIKNGGAGAPPRFDRNRKDIFHYALFAHALGLAKWRTNDRSLTSIVVAGGMATATTQVAHGLVAGAAITVLGAPAASGLTGAYTVSAVTDTTFTFPTTATPGAYANWGLAVSNGIPRSNSGVSDVGGGDFLITLGLWDNSIGSEFMQASTFFHELGHNLDLGHGGDIADPTNCKTNYWSSMSYLFQVRGLLDPSGVPNIDYSDAARPTLNEGALNESPSGLGASPLAYLPRWYAPLSSSFLDNILNTTPASRHCDGTPILDGASFVRIDGISLTASPLDWNGDGNTSGFGLAQDLNFNGAVTPAAGPGFQGFNDWANVNLKQVGARRSPSATSLDIGTGQDIGDDLGIAGGDLGIAGGDLGIAGGDLGIAGGDLGIAGGDLGIAGGDLGIAGGDLGGELDFDSAKSLGNAPNALTAAVVGTNIDLTWASPHVGSVSQYQVWRAACPKGATVASPCRLSPVVQPVRIGFWTPGAPLCDGSYNFCDTSAKNNVVYLYFVTAAFGPQLSGPSNIVARSR